MLCTPGCRKSGAVMGMKELIENKIRAALSPDVLEIIDESPNHSGDRKESHFRLLIVSSAFEGLGSVERQRKVFQVLSPEIMGKIHALSQTTLSPKEWAQRGFVRNPPPCSHRK